MDKQLAQLEDLLNRLLTAHDSLLKIIARKQNALRGSDHKALEVCCRTEHALIRQIGDLEKERLQLVAELTLLVQPKAAQPMSLLELAKDLPEPARGRLLVLRQTLRERMEQVRRQAGVAKRASESLLRHMHGLVQSIGASLTGIGTYSRKGDVPEDALAVSTFNAVA